MDALLVRVLPKFQYESSFDEVVVEDSGENSSLVFTNGHLGFWVL